MLHHIRPYVKLLHMAGQVQVTVAVATVIRIFLTDPLQPRYGYELMRVTGFPSGKLYPILARLLAAGWLTKEREDVDPAEAGRPVRHSYRISLQGAAAARHALAELHRQLGPAPVLGDLRPQGGHA